MAERTATDGDETGVETVSAGSRRAVQAARDAIAMPTATSATRAEVCISRHSACEPHLVRRTSEEQSRAQANVVATVLHPITPPQSQSEAAASRTWSAHSSRTRSASVALCGRRRRLLVAGSGPGQVGAGGAGPSRRGPRLQVGRVAAFSYQVQAYRVELLKNPRNDLRGPTVSSARRRGHDHSLLALASRDLLPQAGFGGRDGDRAVFFRAFELAVDSVSRSSWNGV